jgi:hypothetical protein
MHLRKYNSETSEELLDEINITFLFQEPESLGCLLELTWNAQKTVSVGKSGRKYLEDGDEVIFSGCCKVDYLRSFLLSWN